ncbi:alpha/beta hydrolase [Trichocoleus sp. FACHB-591]|uniref:alpha/beta fold hydrolase n=1 Tax=unclassified Trichocoleus TaxID=2628910 RepID=UPI00168414A2|nr:MULTISPECIES: alpha/beta hydrolase [unclassified Trichocoleus]MBD2099069.1 alpha/beta hydrolase [Trichocoleus sp. FACHB-591]MBD2123841.1 alpha/beta hydrolase [Trichocoleus sp. FACHB-262]
MQEVKSQICFLTPRRLNPHHSLFVFLPGMDGTGQLLRSQTSGLETSFDIRCLAIPPDDLTNWDVLATKVINLIQEEIAKQEQPRAVYLCGESFGGCLALRVATQAPQLFDRLVLVNPASSFKRRPWIQWGSSLTRWLPETWYQISSVGLLPFLASFGRILPEDRQALLTAVQSVPQKTSIWRLSLLNEFDIADDQLRCLTQPVLLLASAADRLLPSLAEAERLAAVLPNVTTVVLPDSGHACLLEANVNLYEIMRQHNFLMYQDDLTLPASISGLGVQS